MATRKKRKTTNINMSDLQKYVKKYAEYAKQYEKYAK
jgi:hypothetical protein